jgi:hypothetical protein
VAINNEEKETPTSSRASKRSKVKTEVLQLDECVYISFPYDSMYIYDSIY